MKRIVFAGLGNSALGYCQDATRALRIQSSSLCRMRHRRHSFAVRRLLTWYQEGRDVKACLPTLSIYLGHVCPEHSYWYLTATPELLSAAAVSFQKYAEEGGQA